MIFQVYYKTYDVLIVSCFRQSPPESTPTYDAHELVAKCFVDPKLGRIIKTRNFKEGPYYDQGLTRLQEHVQDVIDYLPRIKGYSLSTQESMLNMLVRDPSFDMGIEDFHYNDIGLTSHPGHTVLAEKFWNLALDMKKRGLTHLTPALLLVRDAALKEMKASKKSEYPKYTTGFHPPFDPKAVYLRKLK